MLVRHSSVFLNPFFWDSDFSALSFSLSFSFSFSLSLSLSFVLFLSLSLSLWLLLVQRCHSRLHFRINIQKIKKIILIVTSGGWKEGVPWLVLILSFSANLEKTKSFSLNFFNLKNMIKDQIEKLAFCNKTCKFYKTSNGQKF